MRQLQGTEGGKRLHIYLDKIPSSKTGTFWISFESDPKLKKTKANIYGRCLPCIQNLYEQLKKGVQEIVLGTAYQCWKVTVIVSDCEDCLSLLWEFEREFPQLYVYGKIGNGIENARTRAVVFHAESISEKERIREALEKCLPRVSNVLDVQVSRACSVLYGELLGDWRDWRPITKIKYPENVERVLERIKKVLYWAKM